MDNLGNELNHINKLNQPSSSSKIFLRLKEISILIIEDNIITVKILESRLKKEKQYQFFITHCQSLTEGLRILDELKEIYFDLIILDLNLPDSQGLYGLKKLKQKVKILPIIILTGDYEKKLALDAIKAGAQDYLIKQIYLDKKNLEKDSFILPLLTAIERQYNKNQLTYINQQNYLTNKKLETLIRENCEIKKNLEDFNRQLEKKIKQRTKTLKNTIITLRQEIQEKEEIERELLVSEYELQETQKHLKKVNNELENIINLRDKELLDFKLALDQFAIVTIWDKEGNIIYVNDKFCEISLYNKKELIGQNQSILKSKEYSEEFYQQFWQTISQGNIWRGEIKNIKKNGAYFWVDMIVIPFFNKDNKIYQYIAIKYDITERKKAQELIAKNLATFDVAVDGLAILENDSYTYINRANLEMFGYISLDDLPENNWRCFYNLDEIKRLETEIFPLLIKNKVWTGEIMARRKDGTIFPQELSLTMTNKDYIISVCRDITERKKYEQQLKEALIKAEEVNELKSRLITLISHEFRTPLTVISSSVGILKTFGEKLSIKQKLDHFQTIETYIQNITQLLDDILLINRVEVGELTYNPQIINVIDLLEKIMINLNHKYSDRVIKLNIIQDNHVNIIRSLDEQLLTKIIYNLISNSVKYSSPLQDIQLSLMIEPKNIMIQVKDKGIGIPIDAQKYLFDTFYRGDNVGNIQGTGLGLPIVKECVALCKGTITVQSQLNEGTIFSINIPC